jgi:hypothetical protein
VLAAVIRAVKTALDRLDHGENALRVCAGDADVNASENTARQPIPGELLPRQPAIGGSIQSAAGAAARKVPRLPAGLPQGGVHDPRVMRIEADIDRACVLIFVQHLRPGLASIGAAEHAAFGIRTERVAERSDQHDVRVSRVDDDCTDLPAIAQPGMAPALAAIARLVHTIAVSHVSARCGLARTDIDDVVIGAGNRNGTHR